MAFDENRFDEEDEDLLNRDQMANTPGGSGQAAAVTGGSSAASNAGVGEGGKGGWTNIQAYLGANPNSANSASAVNKEVGGAFDQETNKLNSAYSKAQQDSKVGQMSNDDIENNLSRYYTGDHQGATQNMRDYFTKQYDGPTQFDYGMGADAQKYGDATGSREGFQGVMNSIYNKSAGGQMTAGQRALQEQLDVNNPYTAQAQTDLGARYNALKEMAAGKTLEAGNMLQAAPMQLQANQTSGKDFLTTKGNAAQTRMRELEAQKEGWNDAKFGKWEDQYNPEQNTFNAVQEFLGLQAPTTGTPNEGKSDKDFIGDEAFQGGDNMANQGETVDPWADQFTTIKKRKDPWDTLVDAGVGWTAPATQLAKR